MKLTTISSCLLLFFVCAPLSAQPRRFAYVTNSGSNAVTVYSVDVNTGALTLASVTATGFGPSSVVVDLTGRFAYVGNNAEVSGTPSISAYAIDTNTGALTPLPGSPFPTGIPPGPLDLTVHPSGEFLYVANDLRGPGNSFVSAFAIDINTGALTQVPGSPYQTGQNTSSVMGDPAGKFLFVGNGGSNNVLAYSINVNTGALTAVPGSPFPSGTSTVGGAVDPTGRFLYVSNDLSNNVSAYSINAISGALTPIPGSPFPAGSFTHGVAVDATGHFLYAANRFSNNISAYTIDSNTGALTPMAGSPFPTGNGAFFPTIDPSGSFLYVANIDSNTVSAYTISANTGTLTPVPGFPFSTGTAPTGIAFATQTSNSQLTIRPAVGGNAGTVTVQIFGSGFQSGAAVKLTGLGPDIVGSNTTVPNAFVLSTTFNLTGATPGVRNVVVTNPDGTSATLTGGFTVEQGGAAQVSVDIVGRNQIRVGQGGSTFYITYQNTGSVDAIGVPLWIDLPSEISYTLDFVPAGVPATLQASVETGRGFERNGIYLSEPRAITVGNRTRIIFSLFAPAGKVVYLPITLFALVANPFDFGVWTSMPWVRDYGQLVVDGDPAALFCAADALVVGAAAVGVELGVAGVGLTIAQSWVNNLVIYVRDEPVSFGNPVLDMSQAEVQALKLIPGLSQATYLKWADGTLGALGLLKDCGAVIKAIYEKHFHADVVASLDPNFKGGSLGSGAGQFLSGITGMPYSIYFDNQPTATAPAQSVAVTDPLNANLDLTTLILGPITFPNQVVTPPSIPLSVAPFTITVDLRPTTNLLVRVNASVNTTTGVLRWAFQSLDPATGLPPTDPLAGFLPPGAEGSVFFTVMPKSTVTTGTVIQNTATVVFDLNAPINTPTWSNTIDNAKPVSHVSALSVDSSCPNFRVGWSGSDVGSGLRGFTIYASDNGGPFTPWLSNTTAAAGTYMGAAGHAYSFYSIATDLTGNIEPGKLSAEATTTVTGAGSCGPPSLSGQVTSISPSGTTRTVTLQITNTGFTAAQAVNINQITARTLSGSGAVVLTSPVLPAAEGPLAIGASTTVTLTLNVPSTVTRFSLTEGGTLQDGAGHTYSYSMAQTVIP
jgi:6-phosphogluconolactonase (cycloisomerase 2 family)